MARREVMKVARNPPRQSRSRATYEAILDAAIRIFDREGMDAATTSRIAEVAGVSVGTLYQYFANRDQILEALQQREFERAQRMMQELLANPESVSDRAVARAVVEGLLRMYQSAPGLHRVLALEGLRVTPTERVLAFDQQIVGSIRAFLALAGDRIRRKHIDAAAFVVYQSVRASMLAYLLESPAGVSSEALLEELTDLILSYLSAPELSEARRS